MTYSLVCVPRQNAPFAHAAATPAATPPLPDAAVPPGGGGGAASSVASGKERDQGAAAGLPGAAAATGALPQTAAGKGDAAATAGAMGSTSRSGGDDLWIVGRVLHDMDIRLGAKQEKIRTLRGLSTFCWKRMGPGPCTHDMIAYLNHR